eukprot:PhM_4_TR10234/c0_g1_i1/m.89009
MFSPQSLGFCPSPSLSPIRASTPTTTRKTVKTSPSTRASTPQLRKRAGPRSNNNNNNNFIVKNSVGAARPQSSAFRTPPRPQSSSSVSASPGLLSPPPHESILASYSEIPSAYPLQVRRHFRRCFRVLIHAVRFMTRIRLVYQRRRPLPRNLEWLLARGKPFRDLTDVHRTLRAVGVSDVPLEQLREDLETCCYDNDVKKKRNSVTSSRAHSAASHHNGDGDVGRRPAQLRETIRWMHNQRTPRHNDTIIISSASTTPPANNTAQSPHRQSRFDVSTLSSIPAVDCLRKRLSKQSHRETRAHADRDNAFCRNHFGGRVYRVDTSPWWKAYRRGVPIPPLRHRAGGGGGASAAELFDNDDEDEEEDPFELFCEKSFGV